MRLQGLLELVHFRCDSGTVGWMGAQCGTDPAQDCSRPPSALGVTVEEVDESERCTLSEAEVQNLVGVGVKGFTAGE